MKMLCLSVTMMQIQQYVSVCTTSESEGLLWSNVERVLLPHFKEDKLNLQCLCQTNKEMN